MEDLSGPPEPALFLTATEIERTTEIGFLLLRLLVIK